MNVLKSLTLLLHALHIHEFLHVVRVPEPDLHPDEGLPALQAELVPGLGPGQQVGHGALRQAQDGFTEQTLAWKRDFPH